MGLCRAAARFLAGAKNVGVDFSTSLQIGRQTMMIKPDLLAEVFRACDVAADARDVAASEYAEPFFTAMGAHSVVSLDASSYEGATYVHDLNQPIQDGKLRDSFSHVHDGGTLEHVFNIPQALKNCMEMVKLGGHFTQITCANNFMGHGFWQVSPELVYRVFTPENGYRLRAVLLHENVRDGAWFAVDDPVTHGSRIMLCNRQPTLMMTIAQRTALVPVFAGAPQQSDYAAAWQGMNGAALASNTRLSKLFRLMRASIGSPVGFEAPYFTRLSPADVASGAYVGHQL